MEERKELTSGKRRMTAICDIYRDNGEVTLEMEMPGVKKENLDIRVDGDTLFITGRKSRNAPGGKYLYREIRDGDYYNEFTIDQTIDRNKINAAMKNGRVTLTLALKESEKPRKITVTTK